PLSLHATPTTPIYTLSLHDALPISHPRHGAREHHLRRPRALHRGRLPVLPHLFPHGGRLDLSVLRGRRPAAAREALASRLRSVRDRKSTRLNSSHVAISYAVFCLKK